MQFARMARKASQLLEDEAVAQTPWCNKEAVLIHWQGP